MPRGSEVWRFRVEGTPCATCAAALKRAILVLDPEATVQVHPDAGEVIVRSVVSMDLINGAILNAGLRVLHKPAGPS